MNTLGTIDPKEVFKARLSSGQISFSNEIIISELIVLSSNWTLVQRQRHPKTLLQSRNHKEKGFSVIPLSFYWSQMVDVLPLSDIPSSTFWSQYMNLIRSITQYYGSHHGNWGKEYDNDHKKVSIGRSKNHVK